MRALLTLAAVLLTTAAFGQDVAGTAGEDCVEKLIWGIYTSQEASVVIKKLFVTLIVTGVLSLPLIATWDSETIPTIVRVLFWVPAVVAIFTLLAIIALWIGMVFATTVTV